MRDGGIAQRNADHLGAGQFATLADSVRDFTGFAQTHADFAALVAHDDQGTEIEPAAAFDDFGGAIDEHDFLGQLLLLVIEAELAGLAAWPATTASALASTARALRLLALRLLALRLLALRLLALRLLALRLLALRLLALRLLFATLVWF